MMILKKSSISVVALLIGCAFFLLTSTDSVAQDWKAPAKFKTMKNTFAGKKDADKVGKTLYTQHCKSCHGKDGFGDGKKADNLDTEMRDFTTKEVKSQTDGELYYKSFIGRDEMPNFEKKIPSKEDRWLIVNYIRTLK